MLIPVNVSARHVHLTKRDVQLLFYGPLHQKVALTQPGEYACEETVSIVGPVGQIDGVRVLGPTRERTQVEVSLTDARRLGASPPVRMSGDLADSVPITLVGPKGSIDLKYGLIVAKAHVHMPAADAKRIGVVQGAVVSATIGMSRRIVMEAIARVSDQFALEMHIDTDEANAAGIPNGGAAWISA